MQQEDKNGEIKQEMWWQGELNKEEREGKGGEKTDKNEQIANLVFTGNHYHRAILTAKQQKHSAYLFLFFLILISQLRSFSPCCAAGSPKTVPISHRSHVEGASVVLNINNADN